MRGWMVVAAAGAVVSGCSGGDTDDTGATPERTACEGAGDPVVQVGTGGLSAFAAWSEGDTVAIEDDGTGRYGYYADLLTNGLDTTAPIIALIRFTVGDDPTTEDVGASLSFQCPNEGPGWAGVFVPLDDPMQDATVVAGLEGLALEVTALATDQRGQSAEVTVGLVIDAP